jgi:hypothetical protein
LSGKLPDSRCWNGPARGIGGCRTGCPTHVFGWGESVPASLAVRRKSEPRGVRRKFQVPGSKFEVQRGGAVVPVDFDLARDFMTLVEVVKPLSAAHEAHEPHQRHEGRMVDERVHLVRSTDPLGDRVCRASCPTHVAATVPLGGSGGVGQDARLTFSGGASPSRRALRCVGRVNLVVCGGSSRFEVRGSRFEVRGSKFNEAGPWCRWISIRPGIS